MRGRLARRSSCPSSRVGMRCCLRTKARRTDLAGHETWRNLARYAGTLRRSRDINADDQLGSATSCLARRLHARPSFGACHDGSCAVLHGMRTVDRDTGGLPNRTAGAGALPKRYRRLGRSPERRVSSQGAHVIWPHGLGPLCLPWRSGWGRHARDDERSMTGNPEPRTPLTIARGRTRGRGRTGRASQFAKSREWLLVTVLR
jgi:hypothetical protein